MMSLGHQTPVSGAGRGVARSFLARPAVLFHFLLLPVALSVVAAAFPGGAARADGPWGDPRQIPIPPLREIEVPEPARVVLENGMVVYLLEDHEFPLVDARALIRVGGMLEPMEKVGLARITGEVMRTGGTTAVSGDSLDRLLEGLGASVEIGIGDTQGSAGVSTLTEDAATGIRVLADLLRRPAFPEEKIQLAKTREHTSISARNDELQNILFREFPKLVWGAGHPYARHPEHASIEAIGRDDLVTFHREHFHPDRIILTVYGDFEAASMEALLRQAFGDWPRSNRPLPPEPALPEAGATGIWFAPKADATNSGILIGQLGMRMDDPDYPAMSLLHEVLGGGFSGRLVNEIRTKRGLAYDTGSSPGAGMHHPGILLVYAMTQADSTGATRGYLVEEVRKVLDAPVSAEELARARDAILNSLVFALSSKGAVLNRLADYEYYGYPKDFLQRYQEAVRRLGPAELQAAARRHMRPEDMVTIVVGNAEVARPQLEALGTVQEIDITIPEGPGGRAGGGPPGPPGGSLQGR